MIFGLCLAGNLSRLDGYSQTVVPTICGRQYHERAADAAGFVLSAKIGTLMSLSITAVFGKGEHESGHRSSRNELSLRPLSCGSNNPNTFLTEGRL
jgi:hypothetical protein